MTDEYLKRLREYLNNLPLPELGDVIPKHELVFSDAEVNSLGAIISFAKAACHTSGLTRFWDHYGATLEGLNKRLQKLILVLCVLCASVANAQGPNPEPRYPGQTVTQAQAAAEREPGFWRRVWRTATCRGKAGVALCIAVAYQFAGATYDTNTTLEFHRICRTCVEANQAIYGKRPGELRLRATNAAEAGLFLVGGAMLRESLGKHKDVPIVGVPLWLAPSLTMGTARVIQGRQNSARIDLFRATPKCSEVAPGFVGQCRPE